MSVVEAVLTVACDTHGCYESQRIEVPDPDDMAFLESVLADAGWSLELDRVHTHCPAHCADGGGA